MTGKRPLPVYPAAAFGIQMGAGRYCQIFFQEKQGCFAGFREAAAAFLYFIGYGAGFTRVHCQEGGMF
ncbi:MAG: hypothetical protein ACQEQN_11660, partial [Thermodesulfobacteriota bacterium]